MHQGSYRAQADISSADEYVMPIEMSLLEAIAGVFAGSVAFIPLVALVHELGHAVAALFVSRERVLTVLGEPPPTLLEFDVGRFKFALGWPFPLRRTSSGTIWGSGSAGPGARLIVSLAGPLAAGMLLPLFLWLVVATAGVPGWVSAMLLGGALVVLIDLLMNLDPRSRSEDWLGPFSPLRDGPRALAAYREWRNPEAF